MHYFTSENIRVLLLLSVYSFSIIGFIWFIRKIAQKVCLHFRLDVPWIYGDHVKVEWGVRNWGDTSRRLEEIARHQRFLTYVILILTISVVTVSVFTFSNTRRLKNFADTGLLEFKNALFLIEDESKKAHVDPNIIKAIATKESWLTRDAYNSSSNDYGIMQINWRTAKILHPELSNKKLIERLFTSRLNIRDGITVYKDALKSQNGERWLALTTYNGGPRGANIKKCRDYAIDVLDIYEAYNHGEELSVYAKMGKDFTKLAKI